MSSTTKKKYVERELTDDYSTPSSIQSIVKIIKPRGNNLHEVATSTGEEFLASMPPKFRKCIWVKRGDYVLIEPIPEGHKVKAEIVKILTKDHVKHYKDQDIWPDGFHEVTEPKVDSHFMSNLSDSDDDSLFCNPNKPAVVYDSDTSTSSSDDESIELSNDVRHVSIHSGDCDDDSHSESSNENG